MLGRIINWLRLHLPTRIKTRYRGWRLTVTQWFHYRPAPIVGWYRGWWLTITAHKVTGKRAGDGEYFEIGGIKNVDQALSLAKNKVERLEPVKEAGNWVLQ